MFFPGWLPNPTNLNLEKNTGRHYCSLISVTIKTAPPVSQEMPFIALKKQLKQLIENELSPSTYFAALEPMVYQRYSTIVEKFDNPELRQDVIAQLKDELIMYIQDMSHVHLILSLPINGKMEP